MKPKIWSLSNRIFHSTEGIKEFLGFCKIEYSCSTELLNDMRFIYTRHFTTVKSNEGHGINIGFYYDKK